MVYVCTSNFYSFCLSGVLRIPKVRVLCKLPIIDKTTAATIDTKLKKNEKGFIQGFKESFRDQKILSEINKREKLRLTKFEQAGLGAPLKTFKHNPKDNLKPK
jgi:hypothetical protein